MSAKFCNQATDGFSLLGIQSARPFNPAWEPTTQVETNEVEKALSQPYHYLASGSQCFVFASQDGKYVVKFFRQRIYSPSPLLNHLPLPFFLHRYREKKNWKRADKCTRDFESYKLAFDELKEETRLLYVHLNPTTTLQKNLIITDKLQIQHEITLDPINFVLQRRAEAPFAHINRLMCDGKQEEAQQAVASMRQLIENRCVKGFKDRDPDIRTNCGFVDGIAVKLDVGRLERTELFQEPAERNIEIEKVMAPFYTWLETFHPNLYRNFY